mmetsp:Transcript_20477/g.42300  ORF Transcript_20477/g.42300 Transcript_20477/m.42300 type:complete len:131 (+) Transcript_20477:649-1041(+)
MFLNVKPSHVCEEEPTHCIVRVGIGLRIFVVNSVITSPVVNGTLVSDGVTEHEKEAYRERGLIGTVGPQSMNSNCNSKTTDWPQQEGPHKSLLGTFQNLGDANKTDDVDQCDVNAHRPVDRARLPVMANH